MLTFGQLLAVLLEATGITRGQLAAHLGYDISYISRWVSGMKQPSVKNNTGLFGRIADYVVKRSDATGRSIILSELGLPEQMSGQELCSVITHKLTEVYEGKAPATAKAASESSITTNCMLSHLVFSLEENNLLITQSIANAGRRPDVKALEFFIMPQNSDFGLNEAKQYLTGIEKELPKNKTIRVKLVADIFNRQYRFALCRDLCVMLTCLPDRILVELYAKHSGYADYAIFQCKDAICVISYYDVLLNGYNSILTEDPQLLSQYYGSGETYLRGKVPLSCRDSFDTLYKHKFFQSFSMMNEKLRSIHTIMPMLFVDSPQIKLFACQYGITPELLELQHFYEKGATSWSAIIYKSAVVDFLFAGTLNLFGKSITLSQPERQAYLACFLQEAKKNQINLTILSDANPLLGRADIDGTLLLGQKGLFLLSHSQLDHPSAASYSNDDELVAGFNEFWQEINSLAPAYLMQGESAVGFLQQGLTML